jgi:hypothetical protein
MERKMDRLGKKPDVQTDAASGASENTTDESLQARQPIDELDKPRTYKDAAKALGVLYHNVQRPARRGLVQKYYLGTSRPYVKLRDFINLMERSANR